MIFEQFPNNVKELYVRRVLMTSSFVFPQTVAGVGGEMKTRAPFNLGPGSASTTSRRGTKMRTRFPSNCKNGAPSKEGDKKQGRSQSESSGAFPNEEVSARHSTTVATDQRLPPATGALHPSTGVNYFLFPF